MDYFIVSYSCIFFYKTLKEKFIKIIILNILIFKIICFSSELYGYVHSKSLYGDSLKWSNPNQIVLVNPSNSGDLAEDDIFNAIKESFEEWETNTDVSMSVQESYQDASTNINNVYFSDSSLYFTDSSVVAVTQVTFRDTDGEILEADILVNDLNYDYNDDYKDTDFIKNSVTHEIGHLYGLGHSQVKESTMFYQLAIGQYILSEDDIAGFESLYMTSTSKSISGRVIGGQSEAIFGAHVQAISMESGKVVSSAISDEDGSFVIYGLESDNYFLYVSPIPSVSSVNSYYHTIRNDFCDARSEYQGAFYSSCLSSEQGFPKGITLGSDSVDIGDITIRCGLKTPKDYLANKGYDSNLIDIIQPDGTVGKAIVGFFTKSDIENSKADQFTFDLSNLSISSGAELHFKFLSHQLFSPAKLNVEVTREGLDPSEHPVLDENNNIINSETGHNPDFDFDFSVSLSTDSEDNIITLTVDPESLVDHVEDNISDYEIQSFFPASEEYLDDRYFYLIIVNMAESISGNHSPINTVVYDNDSDNNKCTEGVYSYSVSANYGARAIASNLNDEASNANNTSQLDDNGIFSCGSITTPPTSGPPGPFLNFLAMFLVMFLIDFLKNKSIASFMKK